MSHNTSWDSVELGNLDLSYNRLERELSDLPRLVRGQNVYVTMGGKISRRPGAINLNANNTISGRRVDRSIIYETLDNPPDVYLVMSVFNSATGFWELWHQRQNASPSSAVKSGTYRGMDKSHTAHEMIVARGLLYVKFTPDSSVDATFPDRLGSIIFDGTAGTVVIKPWGALGSTSTSLAVMDSTIGRLSANITATTVDFQTNTNLLATVVPNVISIDFEQINVTAIDAGGHVTACTRGFNGTVAVPHLSNSIVYFNGNAGTPWATATGFPITVNQFWQYTIAIKTVTGQMTNRSVTVAATNTLGLRKTTSTGPFFNQIPKIFIDHNQIGSDTTNFNKIQIYRTTDGGGTFYLLDEIAYTGVDITYSDSLATNTLFASTPYAGIVAPVPDSLLGTFATTLTSNTPPPPVAAPKVIGVDDPVQSSPLAYFQGRIWFGIGNVLFFSAQEELLLGIPEESFPSGINGNFFRLQSPITNLIPTSEALYVFTIKKIYKFTGSTLDTFSYVPLFDNVGHPTGHPAAITHFNNTIAFLTNDYRVAIIENDNLLIISAQLLTDLTDQIATNAVFSFSYFTDQEKEWLIISGNVPSGPSNSKHWIYDIRKSQLVTLQGGFYSPRKFFWSPPWTYPSSFVAVGRTSETNSRNSIILFSYDSVGNNTTITKLDPTPASSVLPNGAGASTDVTATSANTLFDLDIVFYLNQVPSGDHVNQKRVPAITPINYSLHIDRTLFNGDNDPEVYIFKDDIFTSPLPVNPSENPPRRNASIGYKSLEYPIDEVSQRFGFEIKKTQSADFFELQNFVITYEPEGGA